MLLPICARCAVCKVQELKGLAVSIARDMERNSESLLHTGMLPSVPAISGKDSAVGSGLGLRVWSFSVASEAFKLLGSRLTKSAGFDPDAKSDLFQDFEIVKSDAHIRDFLLVTV